MVLGLESYKYKYGSQVAELQEAHFQSTLQGSAWGRGRAPGRRHTRRLGQAGDCNQAWSRGGEI